MTSDVHKRLVPLRPMGDFATITKVSSVGPFTPGQAHAADVTKSHKAQAERGKGSTQLKACLVTLACLYCIRGLQS